MSHNEAKLKEAVTALSLAGTWAAVLQEWALDHITEVPNETCTCGHHPIRDNCFLYNRLSDNYIMVGNVCVKKFFDFRPDLIFNCLRRIARDLGKGMNDETITYLETRRILNGWEVGFCWNTQKRTTLSFKQVAVRRAINTKVLQKVGITFS